MQLENLKLLTLALLLNKMGANVKGAGTETLTIVGVESLHGANHNVVQDRIEAGTFMIGAAMTGGDVLIEDAIWEHNRPLLSKMQEMGVTVTEEENGIRIQSDISKLRPVTVKTLPYPGFPTDMQAQFTALMAMAKGESTMIETVLRIASSIWKKCVGWAFTRILCGIQLVSLEGKASKVQRLCRPIYEQVQPWS